MTELSIIDSASGIVTIAQIAYIMISSLRDQYSEGTNADGERGQRMPYIDKEKFRMHIILYRYNPLKVKLTDKEKEKIIRMLDEVPTADVMEVKHGKWKKMWHSYFKQELPCCSVCGHFSAMRWKYCPNCGAKMDGKEKANERD